MFIIHLYLFFFFTDSPKFSDGLPESVEISGHLGKHVKLRCKIDSNPGSFIIWYKEEDEIKSSKR